MVDTGLLPVLPTPSCQGGETEGVGKALPLAKVSISHVDYYKILHIDEKWIFESIGAYAPTATDS